MAPRRRPTLDSAALRARAERLAERVNGMPKSPFVVAVVAAIALLAAALADASNAEQKVSEVGMFAPPSTDWNWDIDMDVGLEAAEILEYGFGRIELDGEERLTVGAVVRNAHPTANADFVFEVVASGGGRPVDVFRIHDVPSGSDALVGYILGEEATGSAEAELALTLKTVSFQIRRRAHLPERFTVLGVAPLLSPEGHQISYRVESELDDDEAVRLDVVFRDADGAIVGGVNGDDHVTDVADGNRSIAVPPGTSVHHFNLRSEEIPESADLSRTEIGPGGMVPGG